MKKEKPRGHTLNMHIADAMLRIGRPATSREIAKKLDELHPGLLLDLPKLRARLSVFGRSQNCIMLVNSDEKPRTYFLASITRDYFRHTEGIESTIIPKQKAESRKQKAEHDDRYELVALRKLWDDVARRRLRRKASVTA